MTKTLIFFGLLIMFMFCGIPNIHGATATPSAQQASSSANLSLQEKLNQLKKDVASKAAQIKHEVNKKLQNKIISGQIINISSNKLTVSSKNGSKTVVTNEYTVFSGNITSKTNKKNAIKSLSDFKTGEDYIVAIGDLDDKNILVAKKIVKITKPENNLSVWWGQISSATSSAVNIKSKDGAQKNLTLTNSTQIRLGKDEASTADLMENKTIIALGTIRGDNLQTSFIYILPTGPMLRASIKPIASPKIIESTKSATKSGNIKK